MNLHPNLFACKANGSIAPDFTLTDLNGTSHKLYDYLDDGYTVFIDFSAVWCGPCWGYHTTHALKNLYEAHGPAGYPGVNASTTDDVMVFFIEGDGNPLACLQGTGCGTQGDWVTGTPYPIICTDGTAQGTGVTSAYSIGYWPTVYQICPDRLLTECGATQTPYALVTSCLPPPAYNDDARTYSNNSGGGGCSDMTPEIFLQNYGLNNLTSVEIDVSLNGSWEYTITYDQTWNNSTQSYEPLNLGTLQIENVILDPLYNLSNGDVIEIDVSMPNGQTDSDPSNNQTISLVVDLGFDNAYWDAPLSIDVTGNNGNSWYLKQVSNNLIIASGFGGVTGATNWIGQPSVFDLQPNECYKLQSVANDVGYIGASYTVTDGMGQIILQGTVSQLEELDYFSTSDSVWTGTKDLISSDINIYPNPAKDNLVVKGSYDYIEIFDLLGKSLLFSNDQTNINVSNLDPGMYILEIKSDEKSISTKIQISR